MVFPCRSGDQRSRTDPYRERPGSQMISTWLASGYTEGSGSFAGRIALIAVAALAVAAYVMLQLRARSRRKAGTRRYDPWDWRTYSEDGSPADRALAGPEEGRRPE